MNPQIMGWEGEFLACGLHSYREREERGERDPGEVWLLGLVVYRGGGTDKRCCPLPPLPASTCRHTHTDMGTT